MWCNFLLASPAFGPGPEFVFEIRIARFTGSTRTWSAAQTLVRGTPGDIGRFHRIASDADGNALVLWTESFGTPTAALKAMRLDHAGMACEGAQVIDSAVGGTASLFADLAVDPKGHAIAVWEQDEGGSPPRSNIAINRFDATTGAWGSAVFAEMQSGPVRSPVASANGGQALLGWIQDRRVMALLQPLADTPGR